MANIIGGYYPNGYELTDAVLNPVTVAGTIALGTSPNAAALLGETVAAWSVINQGSIIGGLGSGIDLLAGGTVTNAATAWIGGYFGVAIQGLAGTLVNDGTINASSGTAGVFLTHGGTVTNDVSGEIRSGGDGITVEGTPGSATNAGTISAGPTGAAIDLLDGGSATNAAGGSLSGDWGIAIQGAVTASVLNDGVIKGSSQSGVFLTGGTVINQSAGQISGAWGVSVIAAAGTVITAGIIAGTGGTAVALPSGFANRVVLDPGGGFNGDVNGGNSSGGSVLELGAGYGNSVFSGIGTQFVNFATFAIDAGADWTLAGTNDAESLIAQGALTIGNATTLSASSAVGDSGGASAPAQIIVTVGGLLSDNGQLVLGSASGGGLLVNGLGQATAATSQPSVPAVILGAAAGGDGLLDVSDLGSAFTAFGQTDVGLAGAGHLYVENGASMQSGGAGVDPSGGFDVAESVGAEGDATVTGAASLLSNVGRFIVGDGGIGSLSIQSGGTVVTNPGTGALLAAVIANQSAASGSSVNVGGAGSNWQIGGSLVVGNAAAGSLNVSSGGAVSASSLDAAAGAGGDGIIAVTGTGSSLILTGSLTLGDQGAGELSILGGATVSAQSLTVGNASAASSGDVDVEGAGSTLQIASGGVLNIGVAGGGSGELTIGVGSTLQFSGVGVESGHASFNNNGGVIDPDGFEFTSSANSAAGVNDYNLYVGNIGALQVDTGTGTWFTPMILTGTSVADAQNNINNNGDTGQWQLGQGGTLIINANTVDAGQAIVFEDASSDTLVIGQVVNGGSAGIAGVTPTITAGAENLLAAGGFAAEIWGYQFGDYILFNNLTIASDSIVNTNTLDLFDNGGTLLGSLAFFNKAGSKAATTSQMDAAATQIACFAAGTRISTARGEVKVEELREGDAAITAIDGSEARITWIGHRAVDCRQHPHPETVWPVRIRAGAFGKGMPKRALTLSPDHSVYVNTVLVPVKHLVNGTTIAQVKAERITYYHVELPRHDVVYADGLPAESYLDVGDRGNFENGGPVVRLHIDLAHHWEAFGCAPLVVAGPELEAALKVVEQWSRPEPDDLPLWEGNRRPFRFRE